MDNIDRIQLQINNNAIELIAEVIIRLNACEDKIRTLNAASMTRFPHKIFVSRRNSDSFDTLAIDRLTVIQSELSLRVKELERAHNSLCDLLLESLAVDDQGYDSQDFDRIIDCYARKLEKKSDKKVDNRRTDNKG